MLRVLDLFSGIGGSALAAHWAGMQTVAFSEIDPYCVKLLAKRFPGIPIFGDIKKLTKQSLIDAGVIDDDQKEDAKGSRPATNVNVHNRTIDVVCGGFP